jgi:hypothetical protein
MSLYYYLYMFLTKVMTNKTNISIAGNNEIFTTVIPALLCLSEPLMFTLFQLSSFKVISENIYTAFLISQPPFKLF